MHDDTSTSTAAPNDAATATGRALVRQLSAIVFTDMVGYTALMQEDEERARIQRDRQRAVLDQAIGSHGGRILQFYGDGTLSVFPSAIEAVRAAVEVQRELDSGLRVPLRIGIHTGDVIYDQNGVLGDGVNVAARIQGLATPGSILISAKVADELKNQADLATRPLGAFRLKNVRQPIEVLAVAADGLAIPDESELGPSRSREPRSVAVLPFVNMSTDPENEFFSDGVSEEIINALTRVDDLRVTARTSSFAFKGRNEDVRDIAAQLGVDTVLEGSVRRAGGRVRIAAQLIDAANGYHLFSEVYDRSLDDIFATQDELARTIVDRLKGHLSSNADPSGGDSAPDSGAVEDSRAAPEPALVRSHTHDTEAYTEYLRGRFHWNKWTVENARVAIRHMERSAEMDPSCALPFSGLATAYTLLGSLGVEPADDAYPRAAAFARHALELEADAGESHLALANVRMYYEWDFEAADASYRRALELTPGSAEAHHMYSRYLKAVGRLDEAVQYMEAAVGMDPLSLPYNHSLAIALQTAGRLDEAESHLRRILGLDASFTASLQALGWVKVAQGELEDALECFQRLAESADDRYAAVGPRALVYGRLGRDDDVDAMAALLERQAREEPRMNLAMTRALIAWGRGDLVAVFERLNEAVEARLGSVVFLGTSPNWRELRSDPRFDALVRTIGIPGPEPAP